MSSRRGQRPLRPAEGREPDGLCSQPTLSRLLQALALASNRAGLGEVLLAWAEGQVRRAGRKRAEETLDLDSVPVVVHGQQPGSEYNGHYHTRCYHPLLVRSASSGLYLGARLRAGDVHTADGGLEFVLPIARRATRWARQVWIRMDAGFPEPELLRVFEAEGFRYVARVRENQVLERLAAPHIHRALGRPVPHTERTTLVELLYQAGKWERSRRVVLVMIERPGELFLDHFFLLTNAPADAVDGEALLARYRARGIAEKDLGEWKNVLEVHLSSTPRPKRHYRAQPVRTCRPAPDSFAANEANLLLSLLSANVLHAAGALLTRASHRRRSRDWFREHVLKVPGRVALSSRQITVIVGASAARFWAPLWSQLHRVFPVRGSPQSQALPAHA